MEDKGNVPHDDDRPLWRSDGSAHNEALTTAARGKGNETELLAMKAELEAMETALVEARTSFHDAKFLVAETRSQSIKRDAHAIAQSVRPAASKSAQRAT